MPVLTRARSGVPLVLASALPLAAARDAPAGVLAVAVVLVAVGVVALSGAPLLSLQVAAGFSLVCLVLGFGVLDAWPVPAMAVLAGAAGRRTVDTRPALSVFGGVAAVGLPLAFALGDGWLWLLMLTLEAAAVLAWGAGRYLRLRDRLTDEGWRQAERLEREAGSAADEARRQERTRIAQDMHDSLGHRLSLVTLQAGALEVSAQLDDVTRAAAGRLRATAAEATLQLHEIVGLLGEDRGADPPETITRTVEDLVERARTSGAPVTLRREGEPSPVDPMVDRAVRRVVQESLTNALKHAPGTPVTVRVVDGAHRITVEVSNPLPAGGAGGAGGRGVPGGGQGLVGLHERVRLTGGTLRAGRQGDTFRVVAELPRVATAAGEPASGRVPGWAQEGGEVRRVRWRLRRDLRLTVVLSGSVVVVLALTFLGLRWYTVHTTGLDPADYERVRVNDSRVGAEPFLPRAHLSRTLPLVPEPPVPAGAACQYYRTSKNPFDFSDDLYRLCWAGDRLTSKDLLREGP